MLDWAFSVERASVLQNPIYFAVSTIYGCEAVLLRPYKDMHHQGMAHVATLYALAVAEASGG